MKTLLAVIIGALAFQTQAAITINASRVIYSGKDKSASLKINNRSSKNYIVQTWLDTGPETPSSGLPIVATPPLVKLRPEQSAQLRFIYSGTGLPADRESLFWVNIQEVPPAPEENNILQFAIRTRLKLFYRPQGIATSLPKAVENLQWQQSANTLSFTNNSPLHITVINAEAIDNKGKIYPLKNFMLLPYSHHAVNIARMQRLHKMKYINDYGAVVDIPIKK